MLMRIKQSEKASTSKCVSKQLEKSITKICPPLNKTHFSSLNVYSTHTHTQFVSIKCLKASSVCSAYRKVTHHIYSSEAPSPQLVPNTHSCTVNKCYRKHSNTARYSYSSLVVTNRLYRQNHFSCTPQF